MVDLDSAASHQHKRLFTVWVNVDGRRFNKHAMCLLHEELKELWVSCLKVVIFHHWRDDEMKEKATYFDTTPRNIKVVFFLRTNLHLIHTETVKLAS